MTRGELVRLLSHRILGTSLSTIDPLKRHQGAQDIPPMSSTNSLDQDVLLTI